MVYYFNFNLISISTSDKDEIIQKTGDQEGEIKDDSNFNNNKRFFFSFFLLEKSGFFWIFFSFILKHSRRLGEETDIIPVISIVVNCAIKFYLWENMK